MNAARKPVVVILFAEALAAPEVAWSLVDAGFRVVSVCRSGRRSALRHSRYVVCHDVCQPEVDLQRTLEEVRELLSAEQVSNSDPALLFPLDDTAVWLCNELKERNLIIDWTIVGPDRAMTKVALDKDLQTGLARESGFNVPMTATAETASAVRAFVAQAGFPVILKPRDCVPVREGHKIACGKWICANPIELDAALAKWGESVPLLLQKFVVGVGEGIFGLATPNGVRAWSAHRRIRMMNPQGSGSSACVSRAVADDLKQKVETLIRRAGWRGLFMVELLRDHSDAVWFVELNGRPWGSIALARRQGLEYPAWSAELALDEHSTAGMQTKPLPGLVCRNIGREFMHLLFVLRGPRSTALCEWPSLWKSFADVLRLRSTDTFYNWRRDDVSVFFADSYYTIHQNVFKGAR